MSIHTGSNHGLTGLSRSQHNRHKIRKIPCVWTQNSLSFDRFLRTRVPYRNLWLCTFVSGTCGIGGVRVKPFSCARNSCRTSGAAFAGLIVCRLRMSLGVDTTRFLKRKTWLVTHEPLKIGSYVVRICRNRTKGRQVHDVTLITCRGFPRSWNFKDVEFPLEHRSSRTRWYRTILS